MLDLQNCSRNMKIWPSPMVSPCWANPSGMIFFIPGSGTLQCSLYASEVCYPGIYLLYKGVWLVETSSKKKQGWNDRHARIRSNGQHSWDGSRCSAEPFPDKLYTTRYRSGFIRQHSGSTDISPGPLPVLTVGYICGTGTMQSHSLHASGFPGNR